MNLHLRLLAASAAFVILAMLGAACSDDGGTTSKDGASDVAKIDGAGGDSALDSAPVDAPQSDTAGGDSVVGDASGNDAAGTRDHIVLSGAVNGTVPAGAKVMLFWQVTSGSPDYVVKLGEGAVSGGTYRIELSAALPALAKNAGVLGVGLIALVDANTTFNDGDKISNKVTFIGSVSDHALIWHDPTSKPPYPVSWMSKFQPGYSCGKVDGKQGSFVTFAPVSCSGVDVTVASPAAFPNWT